MAICNIKDGNIVQAMSQAQAHGINTWAYFQANSTKQSIATAGVPLWSPPMLCVIHQHCIATRKYLQKEQN